MAAGRRNVSAAAFLYPSWSACRTCRARDVATRSRHTKELQSDCVPGVHRDQGADEDAPSQPGVALAGNLELRDGPNVDAAIGLGDGNSRVEDPDEHIIIGPQGIACPELGCAVVSSQIPVGGPGSTCPRMAGPSKLPPVIGMTRRMPSPTSPISSGGASSTCRVMTSSSSGVVLICPPDLRSHQGRRIDRRFLRSSVCEPMPVAFAHAGGDVAS